MPVTTGAWEHTSLVAAVSRVCVCGKGQLVGVIENDFRYQPMEYGFSYIKSVAGGL